MIWSAINAIFGSRKPRRVRLKMTGREGCSERLETREVLSVASPVAAAIAKSAVSSAAVAAQGLNAQLSQKNSGAESNRQQVGSKPAVPILSQVSPATSRFAILNAAKKASVEKTAPSPATIRFAILNAAKKVSVEKTALSPTVGIVKVNSSAGASVRGNALTAVSPSTLSGKTPNVTPGVNANSRPSSLQAAVNAMTRNGNQKTANGHIATVAQSTAKLKATNRTGLVSTLSKPSGGFSSNSILKQTSQTTAVKSAVAKLKSTPVSFGISTGPSRITQIGTSTAKQGVSFRDRIGSPPAGSQSVGSDLSGHIAAYWESFNRNYSKNPDHASATGF